MIVPPQDLPKDLAWVPELCRSTYFLPCPNHQVSTGKGELTNLFCVKTQETLCSSCAGGREVVQVRALARPPEPEFRSDFLSARCRTSWTIRLRRHLRHWRAVPTSTPRFRRATWQGFFASERLLASLSSRASRGSPPGTTDLGVTRPEISRDAPAVRSRLGEASSDRVALSVGALLASGHAPRPRRPAWTTLAFCSFAGGGIDRSLSIHRGSSPSRARSDSHERQCRSHRSRLHVRVHIRH